MNKKKCRFCNESLKNVFVDLGMSPLSNAYLAEDKVENSEIFYPLKAYVCHKCLLVQLQEFESPKHIFGEYAYFSSYSNSWLEHAREYTEMAIQRFNISKNSLVVELASNDGYLLKNFKNNDIAVIGIEPAENVAKVAIEEGIPTSIDFFGVELAQKMVDAGSSADLIIGNNVLAHVPNINDFVGGIKLLLKPTGVATIEFPHLLQLMNQNQFDTIYHEHFSYFSFLSVSKIFQYHGMHIFDVEELPTHGGSLRLYITHDDTENFKTSKRVADLVDKESKSGLDHLNTYRKYSQKVSKWKRDLLLELIKLKNKGGKIVGYGAAAKGNTLLNYCGARTDIIDYVVDRNPYKVGKYLPGTHIPVKHIDNIKKDKPDYLFILPWNLKNEIIEQNSFIRNWGGKFIIPVPEVQIID
jgi:SAM-dependent methyltransferase